MQRRLNVRFLCKFAAVLLFGGLAVHFLHAFQVQRSADSFLRMAEESLEQKKASDAFTSFQHYLTIRPDDVAARSKYALALERHARNGADRTRAVAQMEMVLAQDAHNDEVRHRLLTNLIRLGRYEKALHHIDHLLPTWPKPADLHYARGGSLAVGFKKYAEAAASFEKAASLDPDRIDIYELWAAALLNLPAKEEEPEPVQQAKAVLDRMVKANDKNFQAYLARSRFLGEQGFPKEMKADLDRAAGLAPDEPPVTLALARWHLEHAETKTARHLLEGASKKHPRDAALIKAIAGLDMREGRTDDAIALLRSASKSLPKEDDLAILLIELLIDRGQTEEAQTRLASLRSSGTEPILTDYLKARLAIERKEWTEALTLLERVRDNLFEFSDWQGRVHALLGLCYQQLGDVEQSLTSFQRAVQKDPGWPHARLGLAAALLQTGRVEEALSQLNDLLTQHKGDTPLPGLNLLQARALLAQTLRRSDRERDWAPFTQALEQLRSSEPGNEALPLLDGEMHAARKQFTEAESILTKAREAHPNVLAYWTFAAELAARQNHLTQAQRILDEAEKQLGDSLELRLARVRLWERSGGLDADSHMSALLKGSNSWDASARAPLLRELADAAWRVGEAKQAEKLWQQLADLKPRDIRSRANLLESSLLKDDLMRSRVLITQLRDLEGEQGMWWRYGAVALLIREGQKDARKLDEAKTQLDRLALQHRDWARVPLLRARLEEARGNADSALTYYLQAIRMGDRDPRRIRNVLSGLSARKRVQEADDVVVLLEEHSPLPPDIARQGAEIALALPNPAKVRQRALQPETLGSKDHRTQLWLVRIYHALGEDTNAEEMARKTLESHKEVPDAWIALVRQLAYTGKRDEAARIVERCHTELTGAANLSTLARCYEILGDFDKAEAMFLKGWKEQPGDFIHAIQATEFFQRIDRLPRAIPLLQALVQPSAVPRELLPPLRRRLALAMVEENPANLSKAIAILDMNGKAGSDSPANQRVRALILMTDPSQRLDALKLFKDAARRAPAGDDELYLLAVQHQKAADAFAAIELLEQVLAYQPENPQALALLTHILASQSRTGEAQTFLQRLERLEPSSPRTRQAKEAVERAG